MRVNMVNRRVREKPPDYQVRLAWLGQGRIGHHAVSIKGAKRQDPPIQSRRNLALIAGRFGSAFADKNRMRCSIGIVSIVRAMIDQKQSIARFGVFEGNTAGKSRLVVSGHPDGAVSRQLLITEAEKMAERSRVQA